jgi:flagellar motility protein MotE (MotC chaperone)
MKICPQCSRTYNDDILFCLSDGTPLAVYAPEEQTVVHNFSNPQQPVKPEEGSKLWLVLLAIGGLLVFLVVASAAVIFLIGMKGKNETPVVSNSSNVAGNSNLNKAANKPANDDNNDELSKLEAERDKLQQEKDKLEKDKKALANAKEDWKKNTTDADESSHYQKANKARVIDPPTNIRQSPNGKVICVVSEKKDIYVYGSDDEGMSDSNGFWLYTDVCGTRGVVHSSQLKF